MKTRTLIFTALLLAVLGCQSVNVITDSANKEDLERLKEIDLLLLDYKFKGFESILDKAEVKAIEFREKPGLSKQIQARVLGLLGEISYYRGKTEKVLEFIDLIKSTYDSEERYFILRALLEDKPLRKIFILTKGLDEAQTTGLIHICLAEAYFETGDFRESTAHYDEAFLLLDPKYREYYAAKREMSYNFISNPPSNLETTDILAQSILKVKHIITLTLQETDYLKNITESKDMSQRRLLEKLVEEGYFRDPEVTLEDICKRKDAAYFLMHIAVYLENDQSLYNKYSSYYKANSIPTPVPDVFINDYYFDAVLIIVEREIMDLPDGVNFFPEKTVSGLEFQNMLKRLKAYYR